MMSFGHPIIYRGWEIDRYRKPDRCYYAYAPDYDGLTPWNTQCAPSLRELCEDIDEAITSADTHPEDGDVQQAPLGSGAVPRADEADAPNA